MPQSPVPVDSMSGGGLRPWRSALLALETHPPATSGSVQAISRTDWAQKPGVQSKTGKPRTRHRVFVVAMLLSAVALATYGFVDDLRTQVRLHHTQVHLTQTRNLVDATSSSLASAERLLASTLATKEGDQTSLNQLEGELASANQQLSDAKQGLELANLNMTTIETCLSGVQQAVRQLQAGNSQAAINSIAGVASTCESLHGSSPGGPVYPFDFPDPDVIDVGGTYFAYATNSGGGNIQVIESSNLSNWKTVGDALPKLAGWATPGFTWAPGVIQLGSTFLLYYAAVYSSGFYSQMCLSVAVASQPQGPFVDSSNVPLACDPSAGGTIDPDPYTDGSGNPYLAWKSEGGGGQPTTIWSEALSASGTSMAPGSSPVALLQPTQGWEAGDVEGPSMLLWHGTYYLFYSGNDFDSPSYAIGVSTCQGPLGPCAKPLSGPIYTSQSNLSGPGGPAAFIDSGGNAWLAFHAWLPGAVGLPNARLLFVRRLSFAGGLPAVVAPS